MGDETRNSIYGKKKQEESKEKNTFGKNPFDVWKRGYNPLAGNKTEDGEDLHERVRKGWESRTQPERMVDFSKVNSLEDNPQWRDKGTVQRQGDGSETRGRFYCLDNCPGM